jgi:ABC-type phosphate transport system auxiliary subunit
MKFITRKNIILITVILILIVYNFVQFLEKRNLKNAYNSQIENLKEESKAQIIIQFHIIDSLKLNIYEYAKNIRIIEKQIDSLQEEKSKVIYIHEDTKKKISSFDASELEKYWRDEL